jgi:protein-disulfide isomerase
MKYASPSPPPIFSSALSPSSTLSSPCSARCAAAVASPAVATFLVAAVALAGSGGCVQHASATATSAAPVAAAPVATAAAASPEDDAGVPIDPSDPSWGDRSAPVTIVEFADFQCPYCARAQPAMARIRQVYGPEKVRMVWKNAPLPFHENARPAAEAGAGVRALAGDEAFWRFLALAFDNPGKLGEDAYVAWAQQAGIKNADDFRAGLRAHRWAAKVDADVAEARAVGAAGTPWFFVNGIKMVGAQPFEAFQSIVDAQTLAAQAKVASGTPADRVYALLSKENRAAEPPEKDDDDDLPEDTKTVFKVPVATSPVRGPAGAPVTLVEFADYECPFCVRAEATLREIASDYGPKVRLVFKNEPLPFHKRAEPAAEAALEVRAEKGDAAFWTMHDSMFVEPRDLSDEGLVRLAVAAGARADKVQNAIAKHTHQGEIEADADVADDFQANGTPHFFINGRRLVGSQPKAKFAAIIDEEIKKAQALAEGGTRPEAIYDALTKDGQAAPAPERVAVDGLPASDPARGPATAKVTLHEFADFQCPYCARAEATVKQVEKAYGDRLRVVWHDLPLPFHENAMPAARAAREARKQKGDKGFWAMHDAFFADSTEGTKIARSDLDADARTLGLDMTQWTAALDGDAHKSEVDLDAEAADKLGFKGTPAFVIVPAGGKAGYVIDGAQDFGRFRRLVDRAIGEAWR